MAQKITDAYISGLNEVLRSFKALPKEAAKELREASVDIAEKHMAPSWREAAMNAGPWGPNGPPPLNPGNSNPSPALREAPTTI